MNGTDWEVNGKWYTFGFTWYGPFNELKGTKTDALNESLVTRRVL